MRADTTVNWSNPILYIQLNPPKRSKMTAKYIVIILQAATHATNIKNGPLKRTHIARSSNIICSTLSPCYIHTDLYLHNILSIKLMSSNGLGSTIMNISWKGEREEAAFTLKTLMFLFLRCHFHETERVTPSLAVGICEFHQLKLIGSYFPKRPANFHSMLSRENSTVAIIIFCMFAIRQSRVDLITFQTIDYKWADVPGIRLPFNSNL